MSSAQMTLRCFRSPSSDRRIGLEKEPPGQVLKNQKTRSKASRKPQPRLLCKPLKNLPNPKYRTTNHHYEATMASRRKEPLKRRDSDASIFSPSIMALILVLLFFVVFKVDDEGEFAKHRGIFVLSVMFYGGVSLLIGLCTLVGIGFGWVIHCPRKALVRRQCCRAVEAGG